ncbi:MAG: PHP-associated domain-containing protein [Patescibacteria group bacterium]
MLKAQLHTHTNSDPRDRWISYSEKELIDRAASEGYEVLSITCHDKLVFTEELRKYAEGKGILLLPGIEIVIENSDVLIINATEKAKEIESFQDLKRYKYRNPNSLIVAPHPYFKKRSLGKKLKKKLSLFDAIEYSFFYSDKLNLNKRAEKLGLPMLGTSDTHFIDTLDTTYSLIDADKTPESIVRAIKQGKIEIKTKPLGIPRMAGIVFKMSTGKITKLVKTG